MSRLRLLAALGAAALGGFLVIVTGLWVLRELRGAGALAAPAPPLAAPVPPVVPDGPGGGDGPRLRRPHPDRVGLPGARRADVLKGAHAEPR